MRCSAWTSSRTQRESRGCSRACKPAAQRVVHKQGDIMVRPAVLAASAACACAVAFHATAQVYPAKPVRVIVPFPPAGAADLLTRTLGQKLGEAWGHQLVVDNRPGAGGNLGLEIAAKSAADGYTAVMAPVTTNAIGMHTYAKLGYNLEKDLAPVSLVGNVPHILVSHPTLPVRNV